MVNWHIKTDYLRCNPSFNGRPRYDFVIANLLRGRRFAQLVFVFVCRVNEQDYRLALVRPLDPHSRSGTTKKIDKELSIYRWNIRSRSRCEVIPVDCIIRGAVLLEDNEYSGDYFVIDTLDADIYLRARLIK